MGWYYSDGQQKLGPFSESKFKELVAIGQVTPETLVWREGMSDWQAYRVVSEGNGVVGEATKVCFACGRSYLESQLIQLEEGPICATCKPQYVQRLKEGLRPVIGADGNGGVWRAGKNTLLMEKDARMPHRCVKCNKPAETIWTRKLSYNHPAIFLLILLNILILIIVVLLTGKRATVDIPLCEFHRARIKTGMILGWSLFLGGLSLIVGAVFAEMGELVTLGIICIVASMVVGVTRGRLVYASKIDKEHVWMKGVCREYLDELPDA